MIYVWVHKLHWAWHYAACAWDLRGLQWGCCVGSLCVYTERCALCGCGVALLGSLRSLRSTDWQLYFLNPLLPHATCGISEAENSLVLEEYDGYALCG